jgi:Rhodopsin-like GPCR transmembrane domain
LLAHAKTVSGQFHLSGHHTEHVLTSFAVLPTGGSVQVNFTVANGEMYEDERFIRLRLYRDVEWPKYLKATSCKDKVAFAQRQERILFEYVNETSWQTPNPLLVLIVNTLEEKHRYRPHYWYVVVDDCMLENWHKDFRIPALNFDLKIYNHLPNEHEGKIDPETGQPIPNIIMYHLSADEVHLVRLHTVTLVSSGLLAFLLLCNVVLRMNTAKHTVHVSLLWVALAAGLDAASSLCELLHLKLYERDGIGSYAFDAMAARFEASCDALLVLLLLSVASGWTLPSNVVSVNPNESAMQRLFSSLARPLASNIHTLNAGTVLSLLIIIVHVGLAQWGRVYNDDFESYHDFQHLPGKILMALRIVLGILILAATHQTQLKCTVQVLKHFYTKLAVLGVSWCLSLPLLTYICNLFVPYYLRRPAVVIGSAALQSSSLVLLAWLVTAQSNMAYHQFSHMTSNRRNNDGKEMSLTESMLNSSTSSSSNNNASTSAAGATNGEPRTWKFGKSKIRLD